ncbi:Hypothetical Protein FCC1311_068162 [Hondaea fermentalgiana]|uniref:Uncharacterized protein n=1 Tax=Hondaea fermentalgiana TaxID=2315210 RepID=A0A2R5GI71_9STRA|nr:Hypothetical Protein FCC1311_068162 [Hondaea fermentalgiana]|eukprot:GBG30596.1 Hypothetical Protein FCC1311_068162 [Hondaea fermentalgiana]
MPVVFQVASAGFTYAIYIKRVQAASSFTKRSRLGEFLFTSCKLGVYGLPGLLIAVVITMQGELRFEGVCQQVHSWQLACTFMLMDTLLSLGFLYLFLEPVLQQLRTMDRASAKSASSKRMRHTTRKNLLWSSVAIFSTFLYMMMATILPASGSPHIETYHLRLLYWVILPIDCIVNLFSTLAITSGVWLPKKFNFLGTYSKSMTKTYPGYRGQLKTSAQVDSLQQSSMVPTSRPDSSKL